MGGGGLRHVLSEGRVRTREEGKRTEGAVRTQGSVS